MEAKFIFSLASLAGASDLHLVFGLPPMLRVGGELIDANEAVATIPSLEKYKTLKFSALTEKDLNFLLDSIAGKEEKARFLAKRDLDLGISFGGIRFRTNLSFENGRIKIVSRIIESTQPTLTELGLPENIKSLLGQKEGLILVTGPTGCGKSTTLAAMVNYLNENYRYNIVTFEDPIEFLFSPKKSIISQRQLGSDFLDFASGLKHVLRQDPNVVMVGEMRDLETIAAAITLAETGHLVLATLHTYNAAQTVDRIIDIFPPNQQGQIKSQVSNILNAIISQRLLPKVGGGRVAAREILIRNAAVSNLIRENKVAQLKNAIETGSEDGMLSFKHSLRTLLDNGFITEETREAYSIDF